MVKLNRKDRQKLTERQMRDQMNGIVRNEVGEVIMRNGKYTLRGIDEVFIIDGIWKA